MQAFARRGFQLRSASIETRIAYTGFLLLMLPALLTLVALSSGRMGIDPHSIATHYRGGESEMSFPKTFWQLVEVSHSHLFTIPVVALILSHLLSATPASPRMRISLTSIIFMGALLDAAGPWAIRYLSAGFAYLLIVGWMLLGGGALLIVMLTLVAMWGPKRWGARIATPAPTNRDDKP